MIKFYNEKGSAKQFYRTNDYSTITNVKEYKYIVKKQFKNIEYIFNISTKELLILEKNTLENIIQDINNNIDIKDKDLLLKHNFIVGENEDSLEISKQISTRWQPQTHYDANNKDVMSYLIFTTTDCNARCYYCYENGCKKEPMSIGTASALVDYMKRHYKKGSTLRLSWFGGEPLYNSAVIDYIIDELIKANIPYTSKMISNGYLLNEEIIDKAINKWKLRSVQITLDGTQEVYNKTKNYIYPGINAYQVVLNNIKNAANAGLKIRIRFNVSFANIDNLIQLIADLKNYWDEETRKKLGGYAHLLFQIEEKESDYTEDFINKYNQLETDIKDLFMSKSGRSTKMKLQKGCMTTNQHQVGVLPNGDLCSCEHFTEEEPWGSIFNDDIKPEAVTNKWKEISHLKNEKCDTCLYYPLCYYLAHCPASRQLCNQMYMKIKQDAVEATVNSTIKKYKQNLKKKKAESLSKEPQQNDVKQ